MDAEHLLTLLTDPAAPPRGIKVEGETITGEFDWAWQTLPVPLELVDCVIDHPIILDHTQMAALNLMGCRLPRLSAGDSTITDMLRVRNCEVEGVVIVDWGHFAGNLFAAGAQLINPAAHSLEAVGAEVAGDVFFSNGFRSEGGLIMSRISIGGEFNCEGVTFDQAEGNRAINASHAEIRGKVALNAVDLVVDDSIFLRPRFVSNGQVRLNRTRIGGTSTARAVRSRTTAGRRSSRGAWWSAPESI